MSDRQQRRDEVEEEIARERRRKASDRKFGVGVVVVVVVALLVGILVIEGKRAGERRLPQAARTEPHRQGRVVALSTLLDAYASNEVGADARYKGKRLRVSGTVHSVEDGVFGPHVAVNEEGKGWRRLQCSFSRRRRSDLAGLTPGQRITVVGTCGGMILGNVFLNGCDLVSW